MMLPKGCVVQGYHDVFAPATVRAYRHYGFVLVMNFLDAAQVQALTRACCTAVHQRGEDIFPGIDAQHRNGATATVRSSLQPIQKPDDSAAFPTSASSSPASSTPFGFGNAPLPPELRHRMQEVQQTPLTEMKVKKMHLTLRNKHAVDRAYRKLAKVRARYNASKSIHQYVTQEEEFSGAISNDRIRELQSKYAYEDGQRSFQHYRDSGLLEQEIRHTHHIDDAMTFMQNWPHTWCWLWRTSAELRALTVSMSGSVGRKVGEAAGHLAGEVVLRVYADTATQATPLSNATPLSFAGAGTNFAHPHALGALMGLERPERASAGPPTLLMPGSHHVIRQLTQDGRELSRVRTGGVFDAGALVRRIPELTHLSVMELPALAPGSVLFFNNYLLMGIQANLLGAAQNAAGTSSSPSQSPITNYTLSLLPDRCVFDGERNSWTSRDTHGPLYHYKRGQLLIDDDAFPVIHRALDIE